MATIIQAVNIRLMLARLRPGAAYRWMGDGDFGHTLAAVEWRDVSVMPTEIEMLTEWDAYQIEETARQAEQVTEEGELDAVALATVQAALTAIQNVRDSIVTGQTQIAADLAILNGTPTNAQVIAILRRALTRENATLNGIDGILNRQARIIQAVARIRERVR